MILGLLALVLSKGLPTFWPAQVVRITTLDGREVMGEVDTSERYRPEPQLLERLPEPMLERAQELLAEQDGEAGRQGASRQTGGNVKQPRSNEGSR